MPLRRVMVVDPGHVSGVAKATINPDTGELITWTVDEIPGGVEGLARWADDEFEILGTTTAWPDLVIVEDFVITAGTWKKSRENAVQDAIDGLGFAKGVAALVHAQLEVIAPDGHKTFNEKTKPGRPSKVIQLNLADRTEDGHAEDAGSLFLVGMKRRYPKVAINLLRRTL